MSSGLSQISIKYEPVDDRLLFRFTTRDRREYRLFLSRRFVLLGLWPTIHKLLLANPDIRRLADEEHKKAVISFQHQGMVNRKAFTKNFDADDFERPLGNQPILVTGLKAATKKHNVFEMRFKFVSSGEATITLDVRLFHNFCQLLINAVNSADWGATIGFDDESTSEAQPHVH